MQFVHQGRWAGRSDRPGKCCHGGTSLRGIASIAIREDRVWGAAPLWHECMVG